MPMCPTCQAAVEDGAKFCNQCGEPLQAIAPPPGTTRKWYYNVWFVLLMLFFVLGPFGLPLVWKHPKFSGAVKVTLTVVMIVYTGWLLKLTLDAVHTVGVHLEQYNSSLQF